MEAMAYCVVPQRNFVAKLQMKGQTHGFYLKNNMFDFHKHHEKNVCFATSLATHHNYTLRMISDKLQKLQELQFTVYTMQLITTQLQFCCNNSFSTTIIPYDYNHNFMLKSFFIRPSKFNTWHYEDFL
jgi:hypothetical protein